MKSPIHLKAKVILILLSVVMSNCGVKGPPEPPLVNEASVKKMQPPVVQPQTEPPPAPVIFPIKKETVVNKKKKNSKAIDPSGKEKAEKKNVGKEETDKQGQ